MERKGKNMLKSGRENKMYGWKEKGNGMRKKWWKFSRLK
jgi:hypothetical protein